MDLARVCAHEVSSIINLEDDSAIKTKPHRCCLVAKEFYRHLKRVKCVKITIIAFLDSLALILHRGNRYYVFFLYLSRIIWLTHCITDTRVQSHKFVIHCPLSNVSDEPFDILNSPLLLTGFKWQFPNQYRLRATIGQQRASVISHIHVPPFPQPSHKASSWRAIMSDNLPMLSYRVPAADKRLEGTGLCQFDGSLQSYEWGKYNKCELSLLLNSLETSDPQR